MTNENEESVDDADTLEVEDEGLDEELETVEDEVDTEEPTTEDD